MKTKLKVRESDFIPFSIQITAESVKDARLLYHVLNNNDLRSIIMEDTDYWTDDIVSADMSKHIKCSNSLRQQIHDAITNTGDSL